MPRYVILRHEFPAGHARALHWDLMLEWGTALRTWALQGEPLSAAEVDAEQLADHRLAYLDYEGPVSGDRGRVSRWDAGDYQLVRDLPGELTLMLTGAQWAGRLTLRQNGDGSHFWRVSFSAAPTRG